MLELKVDYLREKKGEYIKKEHELDFPKFIPKAKNYLKATILPLKKIVGDNLLFGRGGVIDENGEYVVNSRIEGRIDLSYNVDEQEFIDEKVVYCGYLVSHWGHFLIEAVARLWYFIKNDDKDISRYVFFVEENSKKTLSGNYLEFFKLLGMVDKISIINKPTKYREVIVPELAYKRRESYSDYFIDIYNTVVDNVNREDTYNSYEKIFFTRSKLPNAKRYTMGINDIDEFFEMNNFKILYPEKLSLKELIYYVNNAKTVAAISGTLPHNMLFCKASNELVIIERETISTEIQYDVNLMRDIRAVYIDANISIYPNKGAVGPHYFCANKYLQKYAQDYGYNFKQSKINVKKDFKRYLKLYRKANNYIWLGYKWHFYLIDLIYESYEESLKIFGSVIEGGLDSRFKIRLKAFFNKVISIFSK